MLLATSEAELQELVDRLDQVSHKYSLLINVDKDQGNGERRHYLGLVDVDDRRQMEKVRPSSSCGQPSDRGQLKNTTAQNGSTLLQTTFEMSSFIPSKDMTFAPKCTNGSRDPDTAHLGDGQSS